MSLLRLQNMCYVLCVTEMFNPAFNLIQRLKARKTRVHYFYIIQSIYHKWFIITDFVFKMYSSRNIQKWYLLVVTMLIVTSGVVGTGSPRESGRDKIYVHILAQVYKRP